MDNEILLPVGIALLATLASAVSQITSTKKSDSKVQFLLTGIVIVCLIANLILTSWLIWREDGEKKGVLQTQEQRFNSTIDKLNYTLKKSDLLLDSLHNVKDITNEINDSLQHELIAQRKIDSNTRQLIKKNEDIISSQTRIYEASDRIVNPLFPLKVQIDIEMPMNSPRLKELKKYALTAKKEKWPFIRNFFQSEDLPKTIRTDFILAGFDLYLLENNVKKISDITPATRQLNFNVNQSKLVESGLDIYFEDSTFYFTLIYNIMTLTGGTSEPSATTIGFSDLPHCFLGIKPLPYMTDYKLIFVGLSALTGLQQSYTMWFGENKGIIDDCSDFIDDPQYGRVYIQKIVSKQSVTPLQNHKVTEFNY